MLVLKCAPHLLQKRLHGSFLARQLGHTIYSFPLASIPNVGVTTFVLIVSIRLLIVLFDFRLRREYPLRAVDKRVNIEPIKIKNEPVKNVMIVLNPKDNSNEYN